LTRTRSALIVKYRKIPFERIPSTRRLLRVPYARRYLAGQSLSILGDTSLWLALAIWVRELTGSNADAGLTFCFMAIPSIGGPLWGTLVDRFRRRPILIGVNAVTGAATLALLFVGGRGQVWLIWLVMAAYGVANSVLGAAQTGYLTTLVPDEQLGDAQGLLSTVREGLRLVSPLIGAGLFVVAGGHVVAVIDAATFLVAAVSVASIPVAEPAPVRVQQRVRAEIAAGLAHIRHTDRLRQVVIALGSACMVIGFLETAMVAVVTTGLHRSAGWLGPFECLMGVGALLGGPTVAAAMRRFGEGRTAAAGLAAIAVGVAALTVPVLGVDAAGAAGVGFGLPWLVAASNTLAQRLTPGPLQGRVSATIDVITGTPQSISIAAGAGLLTVVGYQALLTVVAVVCAAAALWLSTRAEQRQAAIVSVPAPMPVAGP
jgi:MFS family permease